MINVDCKAGRKFSFIPQKSALIIVDMQRDFVDKEGACAAVGADVEPLLATVPRIKTVLNAMRSLGLTIVCTRYGFKPDLSDLHEAVRLQSREAGGEYGTLGPLGRILTQGEAGHEIIEELRPREDEVVIDKSTFGAFCETELESILSVRGVTHLLICGVTTQCCVEGTIREAIDRGYFVMTLEDCCGAFEPALQEGTLRALQSEGHLFGWVGTSSAVINALPRAAVA